MDGHHLPRALLDAVKGRTLLPFVGAGVSMAVVRGDGSRAFPSWHGLLEKAAERLHTEARSDSARVVEAMLGLTPVDYLEVARYAKKGLGSIWPRFLTEIFAISKDQVRDDSLALARAVWRLGSPLVITTNYDRVLDWACPRSHDLNRWAVESKPGMGDVLAGRLDSPTLWQLHGSINDPSTVILTPDGYQRLYADDEHERHYQAALHTLRSLFASRTFLFVGFSLDDPFIERQLAWVQENFSGSGPHYVLTREADVAAMRSKLANADIQPISFADFGAPLLATLAEISHAGRLAPLLPQPEPPARGYLVWEDIGDERQPDHITHLLVRNESGRVQAAKAQRRGLFTCSRGAFWELRWSNRELINQPVPSLLDRNPNPGVPPEPVVIPITDAHFMSTTGDVVSLGGDWSPFYWHNEGVDTISRDFLIVGSVGSLFFIRSEDFIMYQDAPSCFYDSSFEVTDLDQRRVLRMTDFLDEAELARVDTIEAARADELFRADPEYDPNYLGEDDKDPGLTMLVPEYRPDGTLQLIYQFTRQASRGGSDGCWSVYTASKRVSSDFLPVLLESHRQLPAAVLAWRNSQAQPSERWGWSRVYDEHVEWCRALFGKAALL